MARVRPGEEHLHATDGGGVSNAGAIGVRRLCASRPTRREVPLKRVEVGQVELRCNPDSQAAPPGWTPDALRTATMAHGSTETNAMRADCIAAGSSGLARAQAMLTW